MAKSLGQFEKEHGGGRIGQLEKALEQAVQKRKPLLVDVPDENNTIEFALMGDTHMGSIYEATDEYCAFMARVKSEGIAVMLHAGDLLDGHRVYKGHEFEVHALGFTEQMRQWQKTTPIVPGLTTYFITGNHDASMKKLAGIDVGGYVSTKRPDWVFLGEDYGDITLRTKTGREYTVRLLHPDGGTAYALSYHPQRLIESLEGGSKPHMLGVGHYHKAEHLPSYRNVDCIQTGAFQWQTPFMARKGSAAHVGGWFVRVTVGTAKSMSNSIRAEFMAFYKRSR